MLYFCRVCTLWTLCAVAESPTRANIKFCCASSSKLRAQARRYDAQVAVAPFTYPLSFKPFSVRPLGPADAIMGRRTKCPKCYRWKTCKFVRVSLSAAQKRQMGVRGDGIEVCLSCRKRLGEEARELEQQVRWGYLKFVGESFMHLYLGVY